MSDSGEFARHWRALAAAVIGLSAGMSLLVYVNSLFGSYLIAEFGWSRAEYALLGMASLLTIGLMPLVGRLTDLFGVRLIAGSGILAFPLLCLALSANNGDLRVYLAIQIALLVFGVSTTTTVYTRLVADRFVVHRGLALALCASGPAVVGMIGSPLLTAYMDANGWRAGYRAFAGYSAVLGLAALILMPQDPPRGPRRGARRFFADYGAIVRLRAFWLLLTGTILCSLPHALAASQLKLMLDSHHLSAGTATLMVSVFAGGALLGRLISGVALDRYRTHHVAAAIMGLPAIGLLVIATPGVWVPLLALGVGLLGLSFGAEGDILGYATTRYFSLAVFGSVLGLLTAGIGLALACGTALLSATLYRSDSFAPFMLCAAASTALGSIALLGLGRARTGAV